MVTAARMATASIRAMVNQKRMIRVLSFNGIGPPP
jgi:hypothetical protein